MGKSEDLPSIYLTVQPLQTNDVIPGRVRLDHRTRKILGIEIGDIVELIGERSTKVIVWPSYPNDPVRQGAIVRMGELVVNNCGLEYGKSHVQIKKVYPTKINSVTMYSRISSNYSKLTIDFIKRKFEGYPLTVGDLVEIPYEESILAFDIKSLNPSEGNLCDKNTKYKVTNQ